jgi:hypothetical protein
LLRIRALLQQCRKRRKINTGFSRRETRSVLTEFVIKPQKQPVAELSPRKSLNLRASD